VFKKSIIGFFVLLLLYSFCGELLLWQWQSAQVRQAIKHQLKTQIPAKNLHRFLFTQAEFDALQWYKKDKEFKLDHRLYDIVNKTKKNDTIVLLCINDTEEESLFARLDELVNKQLQSKNQQNKNNKVSATAFRKILNDQDYPTNFAYSFIIKNYPNYSLPIYNQFKAKVLVPPPEIALV